MQRKESDYALVEFLDSFCFPQVGIVAFLPLDDDYQSTQLTDKSQDQDLPVFLTSRSDLRDLTVNASSSMLRTTKGGQTLKVCYICVAYFSSRVEVLRFYLSPFSIC